MFIPIPGLFSVLMREQANMGGDGPKWMVMDGDIDPMWIESLNTVMDDNKVGNSTPMSTLASALITFDPIGLIIVKDE